MMVAGTKYEGSSEEASRRWMNEVSRRKERDPVHRRAAHGWAPAALKATHRRPERMEAGAEPRRDSRIGEDVR